MSQFTLTLRIVRGLQAEKQIKSLVHVTKLSKANTRTNSQGADEDMTYEGSRYVLKRSKSPGVD